MQEKSSIIASGKSSSGVSWWQKEMEPANGQVVASLDTEEGLRLADSLGVEEYDMGRNWQEDLLDMEDASVDSDSTVTEHYYYKYNINPQRTYEKDLVMLRDDLIHEIEAVNFYLKSADELSGNYEEFFRGMAEEELDNYKRLLGLLGRVDPILAMGLHDNYLSFLMDYEIKDEDVMLKSKYFSNFQDLYSLEKQGHQFGTQQKKITPGSGSFRRSARGRSIDKNRVREILVRSIHQKVWTINMYERQLNEVNRPEIKHTLNYILNLQKSNLSKLSYQMFELVPTEYS